MTLRRTASRSDIQQRVEQYALDIFSQQLGVTLSPTRLLLRGVTFNVDGYHDASSQIVLVEIWAHVGPAKAAQKNKVLTDLLKLALITKILLEERPAAKVASYIVFVDREAASVLDNKSWGAAAAREFGVQGIVVELDTDTRTAVAQAQLRQDLRNAD